MRYAHLYNAVFCEPWALRPDYHASFARILRDRINDSTSAAPSQAGGAAFVRRASLGAAMPGQPIVGPCYGDGEPLVPQMVKSGALALIPVWGVLGRRLSLMDLQCGGCDYEHLSQFFTLALNDESVRMVVIDFDTPGGRICGLPECAAALARLAAAKPVIGYTSGLCCSAGYYLAAYCRELYASPSADVGNIGARLAAVDDSEEWAKQGLRLELFVSGEIKGTGTPGKPFTDADRAFYQGILDVARDDFFAVVARERPQVSAACLDGRWMFGSVAQPFGLIDGVAMSLQELVGVAAIASGIPALGDYQPGDDETETADDPCAPGC